MSKPTWWLESRFHFSFAGEHISLHVLMLATAGPMPQDLQMSAPLGGWTDCPICLQTTLTHSARALAACVC